MSKQKPALDLNALMRVAAPAPAPEPDEDPYVGFSNRARRSVKRQLGNLARRTFKTEQWHLDQALRQYLAAQAPADLRDIPGDE